VYDLVDEVPGLHQREIARRLDLGASHAEYHLHQLAKAGLLKAEEKGGYKRYFVAVEPTRPVPEGAVAREDRPWVGVLRQERPLEVVAHLLQEGPTQMSPLADRVGIATSTLSHHVDKLEDAGIVERYREGNQRYVRLTDRERLVRVLLQHEPPADLVDGFEDLWDDIGF
jgi:DNA-binding transcriptional ArsR family regulator